MALKHVYTNYYTDTNVEDRGRSLSDFYVKEYRFRINADEFNHAKTDKFFKDLLNTLKEKELLNVEYYTYIKEEV